MRMLIALLITLLIPTASWAVAPADDGDGAGVGTREAFKKCPCSLDPRSAGLRSRSEVMAMGDDFFKKSDSTPKGNGNGDATHEPSGG